MQFTKHNQRYAQINTLTTIRSGLEIHRKAGHILIVCHIKLLDSQHLETYPLSNSFYDSDFCVYDERALLK
jgi:hypothetical protein